MLWDLGPTAYGLIYLNYLLKSPVSKYNPTGGKGASTYEFSGDTVWCITHFICPMTLLPSLFRCGCVQVCVGSSGAASSRRPRSPWSCRVQSASLLL